MNRQKLVEALSAKTGDTKGSAGRIIAAIIETITSTLKNGGKLSLVGFGTFKVRKRSARAGRNPATRAAIKIKASKQPDFKAEATLKASVNGTEK